MVEKGKHGIEGKLRNDYEIDPDNIKSFLNIGKNDEDFSIIAIVGQTFENKKENKKNIELKIYKTNTPEEEIRSRAIELIKNGESYTSAALKSNEENGKVVVDKWFEKKIEGLEEKLRNYKSEDKRLNNVIIDLHSKISELKSENEKENLLTMESDDSKIKLDELNEKIENYKKEENVLKESIEKLEEEIHEINSFRDGNEINETVRELISDYKPKKDSNKNKYFNRVTISYSNFDDKINDLTFGEFITISKMSSGEERNDKTFLNFTDNSKVTHIKKEDAIEYLAKIKEIDEKIIRKIIIDLFEDKLEIKNVDKKFSIALVEKIQKQKVMLTLNKQELEINKQELEINKQELEINKLELESKEKYSPGDMVIIWVKGEKIKVKKIEQKDEDILLNYLDFLQKISKEDFKNWVVETRDEITIEQEEISDEPVESTSNSTEVLNQDYEKRFKEVLDVFAEIIYLTWRINNLNQDSKEFSREIVKINKIFESYRELTSFINSDIQLKESFGEDIFTEEKIKESERFLKKTKRYFKIMDKDYGHIEKLLPQHGFKVESYKKGELFVDGIDILQTIKNPNIDDHIISETIKPTIRYDGKILMRGQVIVQGPTYDDFLQKISKEDFKNWVVETRDEITIEQEEISDEPVESTSNSTEVLNQDYEKRFKEVLDVFAEIIYLTWRINNLNQDSKEFSREIVKINKIFESYRELTSFINSDIQLKESFGEDIFTEEKIKESERFLKKTKRYFKIMDKDYGHIEKLLPQHGFKVESYKKGELFVDGIDILQTIKNPNIDDHIISETIKPTIRYDGKILMRGQVIVQSPT